MSKLAPFLVVLVNLAIITDLLLLLLLLLHDVAAQEYTIDICPGAQNKRSCECAFVPYDFPRICPAGKYCPSSAEPFLEYDCTPGLYCPENTSQPIYCCEGFFCRTPLEMKICPQGEFCQEGSVEGTPCSSLSTCDEGSSTERRNGVLVMFFIISIFFYILYSLLRFRRRRQAELRRIARGRRDEAKTVHNTNTNTNVSSNSASNATGSGSGSGRNSKIINNEGSHLLIDISDHHSKKKSLTFDIEFKELGLTLKSGVTIMAGVTGSFKAGRVTAVMGPSGAGKTTFLSLLSGKVKRTKGDIFINGKNEPLGVSKYKRLVGFVPQEDVMIRELTVKENLLFSACFRLPSNWTTNQIHEIVNDTIDILGLGHIEDSPIGDERQRGISGGQRKRVNIGMELVADPSILFLDEPTSGLDSTSSGEVLEGLRRISHMGINVSTVIHQPRYEIFQMFDDCLLLGKGGKTVYIGPANEALKYFENLGFRLPPHANPSDFFMDVISGKCSRYISTAPDAATDPDFKWADLFMMWENYKETQNASAAAARSSLNLQQLMANRTSVSDIQTARAQVENKDDIMDDVKEYVIDIYDSFTNVFRDTADSIRSTFSPDPYRVTPGFFQQTAWCFVRGLKQNYRDGQALLIDSMIHFFVGTFLGIASRQLQYVGPLPNGLVSYCPYALVSRGTCTNPLEDSFASTGNLISWGVSFAAIAASVSTFGNEKVVYWREASSGLNTIAYFIGKLLSDLPKLLLASTLFLAAYIFIFSPNGDEGDLFLIILMLYWCGWNAGYFISNLFRPQAAPLVGVSFALIWSIVFSGVNPRLSEIKEDYSSSAQFFWDISYARWGIEAFYIVSVSPFDFQENYKAGYDFWGYEPSNFDKDIRNMFFIGCGWSVLAYLALRYTNRDKQV